MSNNRKDFGTKPVQSRMHFEPLESANVSWKPTNFSDGIDLNRQFDDLTN
jgi:hypothetical protein